VIPNNPNFVPASPRQRGSVRGSLRQGVPPPNNANAPEQTRSPNAQAVRQVFGAHPAPFTLPAQTTQITQTETDPVQTEEPVPEKPPREDLDTETTQSEKNPAEATPVQRLAPRPMDPDQPVPSAEPQAPFMPQTPGQPLLQTLLNKGWIVAVPDPQGGWHCKLAPRVWSHDNNKNLEIQSLLRQACLQWVGDRSQSLQAIAFLEEVINSLGGSFGIGNSLDELRDLLLEFAPALREHYPPPCAPQHIPRIRAAVEFCCGHLEAEKTPVLLLKLSADYCPWLEIERALSDIAGAIAADEASLLQPRNKPPEWVDVTTEEQIQALHEAVNKHLEQLGEKVVPVPPPVLDHARAQAAALAKAKAREQPLALAQHLQALQQQAMGMNQMEMAREALALAHRVARLSMGSSVEAEVAAVLDAMTLSWCALQAPRYATAVHFNLFGTVPTKAVQTGSGTGAHFGFNVDIALLEPWIIQVCQIEWQAGNQIESLALLNDALSATRDADLRERLLLALAGEPGFVEHVLSQPRRQGIVEAAFALLPGWWLSAPPHAFELEVRESLIGLVATEDWEGCLTLFEKEFSYGLNDTAQERLEGGLARQLVQRLEAVLRGARERRSVEWQQRCLRWAQQLAARLDKASGAEMKRLRRQCKRLIEECRHIPLEHYLAALSDWLAVVEVQAKDGHVDTEIRINRRSPALQTQEGLARARARFIDYIDLLLESPQCPGWGYVVTLATKASSVLGAPFDDQQLMNWCLREAGLRTTKPLEQLIRGLVIRHAGTLKVATEMLFDALLLASDRGLPWTSLKKVLDTVFMMGWQPSAQQKLTLVTRQAQRGNAQPLLKLLEGSMDLDELNRPLVHELLALGRLPQLKRGERIRLLSAAKAQFTQHAMQADDLDRALKRLREERQQLRQRKAAPQRSPRKPPMPPAQRALAQWADVDLSQPALIKVSVPPDKAPKTAEECRRAQAALLAWLASMQAEAQPRPWSQLLSVVEGIEIDWGWNIDRQRLLALCLEQVAQDNSIQPLLDHLPLLHEVQPSLALQAQLLSLATRQDWDAAQRAALLKRLIAWAPASGVLNALCVQAIRSLPEALRGELPALLLQHHGATLTEDLVRQLASERS